MKVFYLPSKKGAYTMYVRTVKNKLGKPMYLLIDDNGKTVKEVYKYILHLARVGRSKNTMKNNAHNLKLFYDWLSFKKLTIFDIVHGKDSTHKSTVDYLSDFVLWLKYPTYDSNVILFPSSENQELKPKRSNNTINQIMSCIYGFYDYLSLTEDYPELKVYQERKFALQNHSLLSEMKNTKERGFTSAIKLKPEKKKPKFITREEFWKIYYACTCRRDRIICGLMFDGALRVSEVVGLHIEDFAGLHEGRIDIVKREDLANEDAAVKYDSEGYIIIPDYLIAEIVTYMTEISAVDTNYFIFNMYGDTKFEPMRTDTIRDMIEKTGRRAGITRQITPHMFRHGIAVELADLIVLSKDPKSEYFGLQMVDIKEKLRHSCLQSSEVYAECTVAGKKGTTLKEYEKASKAHTEEGLDSLASQIRYRR